MCLYSNQICPIRARKPIKVYKVVRRLYYKQGILYRTPYVGIDMQPYKKYKAIGPKIGKHLVNFPVVKYRVNIGYIHCLTSLDEAKKWIRDNSYVFSPSLSTPLIPKNWAIIECTIPKGTLYYKSYEGDQIAARELSTEGIVLIG